MTDELRNDMRLDEVEEWCKKGHSLKDAAFGLLFKACSIDSTNLSRIGGPPSEEAIEHANALRGTALVLLIADIAELLKRIELDRSL